MSKFSFKNPFAQDFDEWKTAAQNAANDRTAAQANELFKDKPYIQENRSIYRLSNWLRWAAAAVSFLSAYFAAYYVFSVLFGAAIAVGAAVGVCLLIELLKTKLWTAGAKSWLKYGVWSGAVIVLFSLHLLSFGASVFGAYVAADYLPTAPINHKDSIVNATDAALPYDQQLTAINGQITGLLAEKPNPTTGKISGTTKGIIKDLTAQKDSLQTAKNRLLAQITKHNEVNTQQREKNTAQANLERQNAIKFYRYAAAVFAGLFELIFIVCQMYVLRYLFRAYIDSKNDIKTTILTTTQPVTQPVTTTENEPNEPNQRQPIGFKTGKIGAGGVGSCANCGKEFVKNSHSHKFCSELCRVDAWEKKHGKKLVVRG